MKPVSDLGWQLMPSLILGQGLKGALAKGDLGGIRADETFQAPLRLARPALAVQLVQAQLHLGSDRAPSSSGTVTPGWHGHTSYTTWRHHGCECACYGIQTAEEVRSVPLGAEPWNGWSAC